MKFKNIIILGALVGFSFTACNMDTFPEGEILTGDQKEEVIINLPKRLAGDVNGMYASIGKQYFINGAKPAGLGRHDDYGYPMLCLSQDINGPDMVTDDTGFNWFAVSADYEDRSDTYANPYMRWAVLYYQIRQANDILELVPADTQDKILLAYKGQAKTVRAFDYLSLVPYYQFKYKGNEDKPSVPIVREFSDGQINNPRASLRDVYKFILDDLDDAIALLEGFSRTSKGEVDQKIAYGLRARAHLYMENWAAAAADADKAMEGYTPSSRADVSTPAFISANEANWMWAILIGPANMPDAYPSWPAWLGSFSGNAYSTGAQCYKQINTLLFNKIPASDVRKGWWVDDKLHSDNLANVTWDGVTGDAVASLVIKDVKEPFLPYTNVKFGQYGGIGNDINAGDWCLMRVEELILIKAEATAMAGELGKGKTILQDFVKNYRDEKYESKAIDAASFQNEVWFQRRVELWGEGFSMSDIMRLGKPIVRFNSSITSNHPDAFKFNIAPDDEWLLLRIPQKETNTNPGIPTSANNNGGSKPKPDAGKLLRDGVTD